MRRVIGPAVLALALVLGGCAAASNEPADGTAPADGAAPSDEAAQADEATGSGHAPLEAGVSTLAGPSFDAASVAGEPVILWFWAPWCTICRAEAPDVAEVAAELEASGSPVVLLGVPGRGEVPEMADFVNDTGTGGLNHLVDADGSLWRSYGIIAQPAFAFISPGGSVETINGALGADALREAAQRLAEG